MGVEIDYDNREVLKGIFSYQNLRNALCQGCRDAAHPGFTGGLGIIGFYSYISLQDRDRRAETIHHARLSADRMQNLVLTYSRAFEHLNLLQKLAARNGMDVLSFSQNFDSGPEYVIESFQTNSPVLSAGIGFARVKSKQRLNRFFRVANRLWEDIEKSEAKFMEAMASCL